jgi:hypothetical protein
MFFEQFEQEVNVGYCPSKQILLHRPINVNMEKGIGNLRSFLCIIDLVWCLKFKFFFQNTSLTRLCYHNYVWYNEPFQASVVTTLALALWLMQSMTNQIRWELSVQRLILTSVRVNSNTLKWLSILGVQICDQVLISFKPSTWDFFVGAKELP